MSYGIPYKGSKNKVTKWLLSLLPKGEVFVDLFCGGSRRSETWSLSTATRCIRDATRRRTQRQGLRAPLEIWKACKDRKNI